MKKQLLPLVAVLIAIHVSCSPRSVDPPVLTTASRGMAPELSRVASSAAGKLVKVPSARWGTPPEMKPRAILVDSTQVQFEPGSNPFPFDLDFEGNYLFIAAGTGIMVIDVTNPASPDMTYKAGGKKKMLSLGLTWGHSDKDLYIKSVDAPPGNHGIFATAADEQGLIIWNSEIKNNVSWHYQDNGRFISVVYAMRLSDNREYVFALDTEGPGIALYDLTSAVSQTRCSENTSQGQNVCGLFEGFLPVSGVLKGMSGWDEYLAVRTDANNVKIYRVDSPGGFANLPPRLAATLPGTTNGDAVLWKYDYGNGSKYYMATLGSLYTGGAIGSTLRIYEVDCIAGNDNCSLSNPIAEYDVTDHSRTLNKMTLLTMSVDNGNPYLYVGNPNAGSSTTATCLPQREFPLDLSRFDPVDPPPLSVLDLTPHDHPDGYWGFYYSECYEGDGKPPGFNGVVPMRGKVHQGHLYRAGNSFCDSHEILAPATPDPPRPPGELFDDGFESGGTSAWSKAVGLLG